MGIQPKVTKNTTNFNGCKVLRNTVIISVKGNNRKWKYLQKISVNAPTFLKLHSFIKECKTSNKPVIMVYWNGNQNQIIMAKNDTKNQKVTKMHPLKKVANCTGT